MSAPKNINRKAFLSSTLTGMAALTFGGCGGDESDDSQMGTGGSSSGGSSSGGASTGGRSSGGGSSSGGRSSGGSSSGGASTGGASTGGASTGGASSGGASGGLGGVQEMGGAGGEDEYMCTSTTDNGNHSHPLTVPGADIDRGYQDGPYLLEDGGTGHTHTLQLSAYDFLYLAAGATIEMESSEDNGHSHPCFISCTLG